MRLYHMTSFEAAVNFILPERRMRLSRFHRLNDPFELMSLKLDGPMGRRVFKALFNHFDKDLGILCMVKHWQSPLMWGHYAANHHGVCLGFDVPRDMPRPIHYTLERTTHVLDPTDQYGGITYEQMMTLLTTKSLGWSYEEEWRLFSNLKEADPDGEFYLPFGESLSLREIIVGPRCSAPVGSFRKLLRRVDQSVTIIKARPAFDTFTMVRQQRVSAITVKPKQGLSQPAKSPIPNPPLNGDAT
jgi:hypothetical protein